MSVYDTCNEDHTPRGSNASHPYSFDAIAGSVQYNHFLIVSVRMLFPIRPERQSIYAFRNTAAAVTLKY